MTKANTLLHAGKQLVAIAAGRAFRGEPVKTRAEDLVGHSSAERQGAGPRKAPPPEAPKRNEAGQDPGNPNAVDHDDQDPGQEKG